MSSAKRKIVYPTPQEDAAIRAGIAADPDTREFTSEETARMRPASEVVPHIVERWSRTRDERKKSDKERVSIQLDSDLVAHFRNGGEDWQTRLNDALRRAVLDS